MHRNARYVRGVGLLEMVVGVALLTTIFVGLFGLLQLGTRLATDSKTRTSALALAQERVEYIRSLPYNSIGTVGGNPSGSLATTETITLNNTTYTRTTYIVYIDDPKDGSGAADSNGKPNDYKRIKVTVSWTGPRGIIRDTYIITDITPLGIET